MEYLSRRRDIPFEVQAFTEEQLLEDYLGERRIDVLLAGQGLAERLPRGAEIGALLVLAEDRGTGDIYKYQSSEAIWREVMRRVDGGGSAGIGSLATRLRGPELIGIYSPVKRCGKTSLALALGKILSERFGVLYLNFEEYSGFPGAEEDSQEDFSDIMLGLLEGKENLEEQVDRAVRRMGNMEYIPPGLAFLDIRALPFEEWERFLDAMEAWGRYDKILLDLGDSVDEVFQILSRCGTIFMPVLEDRVSRAKLEQFDYFLEACDLSEMRGRIRRVSVPKGDWAPWELAQQTEGVDSALEIFARNLAGELYGTAEIR